MKVLEFAAKIANKILMVLVIIFSLILFMFSVYVLYDVFYTEKNAFISYDLLQYRPEINSTDPEEEMTISGSGPTAPIRTANPTLKI